MNPYAPGMARRPLVLAGRDEAIGQYMSGLEQATAGLGGPFDVLIGLRGMGKTTLLAELADRAETQGWVSERFAANPMTEFGLASQLLLACPTLLERLDNLPKQVAVRTRKVLNELQVGVNLGVVSATTREPKPPLPLDAPLRLERAITELGTAAKKAGQGIALFIDELHEAREHDLRLLGNVIQQVNSRRLPVVFAAAGLPMLVRVTTSMVTFTERARWVEIGNLTPAATAAALIGPAETQGVTFTNDALTRLADISEGYPYLIQVAGGCVFDIKGTATTITLDHVTQAEPLIARTLDLGVYKSRWERATENERDYLVALARLCVDRNSPVPAGDVAAALGKPSKALSRVRSDLIDKGTITANGRLLEFAMPFLDRYILTAAEHDPNRSIPRAKPRPTPLPARTAKALPPGRGPKP
jgi:hypothetical protein